MNQTSTPLTKDTLLKAGFEKKILHKTVYYEKGDLSISYCFGKWILLVIINDKPYFLNLYVNSIEELDRIF